MNRPDTKTQKQMIMKMAASIIQDQVDYCESVSEQHRERGNLEIADKWSENIATYKQMIEKIDENMGCW